MTEEIKTQNEKKNTVATVGMWFSIIGLILAITLFFAWLGMPLLFLGFVLGIIGLFYKPRKKAWVAVSIPLVVFIVLAVIACYIGSSLKNPINDFVAWTETKEDVLKDVDGDKFGDVFEAELKSAFEGKSPTDLKNMAENSTGSNTIEKFAYFLLSIVQQGFDNALEKYNNGEFPELDEENDVIDVDIEVDEENDENNENKEDNIEVTVESDEKENSETFSQSEKNDIEQIINILE